MTGPGKIAFVPARYGPDVIGGAEIFALGGDSDGTFIGMTDSCHDTTFGDHRDRSEAIFFSTHQRGDNNIPA